ncbi:Enoyl-CoA hydratase [Burkholderiales bacterium]|nr:Enoyl-CoA hydratase [Burkholderiales bacterium]
MYQTLSVERGAATATIWMNRPQVHNAFNEVLIEELDAASRALEVDPAVRVVIVAGKGRNFCAGADLHWMGRAAAATMEENLQDARRFARMLYGLARMSKPTLARVHGAALGGGMGIAAACDICVATHDASFAMSEARLGLIPAVISPYVVRAIGPRQALRYVQSAERISAARAAQMGLAHEVVAADELDGCVRQICEALCAGGPRSQAAAKALVFEVEGREIADEVIERTARAIAQQRTTDEAAEGMAAFFAKRAPHWVSAAGGPTP